MRRRSVASIQVRGENGGRRTTVLRVHRSVQEGSCTRGLKATGAWAQRRRTWAAGAELLGRGGWIRPNHRVCPLSLFFLLFLFCFHSNSKFEFKFAYGFHTGIKCQKIKVLSWSYIFIHIYIYISLVYTGPLVSPFSIFNFKFNFQVPNYIWADTLKSS
jgi:hypothetical protein